VNLGVLLIRAYQLVLGPLVGGACRFEPSCSEYALAAVRTHGSLKGLVLALRRVARCHPFGRFGYDPVPPAQSPGPARTVTRTR
jgi:putative membrane protein insertion efficiency factor